MRFPRTVVTMTGLALAGLTAVTGVGEPHAGADPARPAAAAPDPQLPPRPATILAAEADEAGYGREVYEFDTAGAGPARIVAAIPEGEIVDVERAPDGTVYYAAVMGDTHEIRRLDAGGETVVASGWGPAVSPDGRWLAFAYFPPDAGMCAGSGLAVLDLVTGAVRRYPGADPVPDRQGCPESDGPVGDISWAPDSRRVVFENWRSGPRILDTATAGLLADAVSLDAGRRYRTPAWLTDGRIAVAEFAGRGGVRILAVDPDTRDATEFAPAEWQAGGVNSLDADATGRHLVVSLDGVAHSPRVFLLAEGAPPEELDRTYGIAVW
jgi:dipeptidyl aminopeptidase/acylaminoacyl peptidase